MLGKIYFFIGTTAELIKLAPVIREFEKRKVGFKVITSGQTDVNFDEVKDLIKTRSADIALAKKKNKSSVFLFLIWALKTAFATPFLLFRELVKDRTNTFFIVHGDTVTSLVGAFIAKIFGLKVVHIESGLRSFNFFEPFPEEISRYLISRAADTHFCPNKWALNNLKSTGGKKVVTFQNTFVESVNLVKAKKPKISGKYFILILHRQEHVIFNKKENKNLINFVIKNSPPGVKCVFVRHATSLRVTSKNVSLLPRLPFSEFAGLLKDAEFIVTDGGGNQEEAYYLGLPCLLLRNRTERIEGLGENTILAKGDKRTIKKFMDNYTDYKRERVHSKIRPSKIIVDYLLGSK